MRLALAAFLSILLASLSLVSGGVGVNGDPWISEMSPASTFDRNTQNGPWSWEELTDGDNSSSTRITASSCNPSDAIEICQGNAVNGMYYIMAELNLTTDSTESTTFHIHMDLMYDTSFTAPSDPHYGIWLYNYSSSSWTTDYYQTTSGTNRIIQSLTNVPPDYMAQNGVVRIQFNASNTDDVWSQETGFRLYEIDIEVSGAAPPDSDDDGVSDATDQCPNTPLGESVDGSGCSPSQLDSDDDGVSDATDQCPNTPLGESVDGFGCSPSQLDSDDDGVSDATDQCPNTPLGESVDGSGCSLSQLDSDDDDVTDDLDVFPNDSNETQDSDGDGVGDNGDEFPSDPTQQIDTDGDGFGDNSTGLNADDCPQTWGNSTVDLTGCLDRDGDGTSDLNDALPDDPNQSAMSNDTTGDGSQLGANESSSNGTADGEPQLGKYHMYPGTRGVVGLVISVVLCLWGIPIIRAISRKLGWKSLASEGEQYISASPWTYMTGLFVLIFWLSYAVAPDIFREREDYYLLKYLSFFAFLPMLFASSKFTSDKHWYPSWTRLFILSIICVSVYTLFFILPEINLHKFMIGAPPSYVIICALAHSLKDGNMALRKQFKDWEWKTIWFIGNVLIFFVAWVGTYGFTAGRDFSYLPEESAFGAIWSVIWWFSAILLWNRVPEFPVMFSDNGVGVHDIELKERNKSLINTIRKELGKEIGSESQLYAGMLKELNRFEQAFTGGELGRGVFSHKLEDMARKIATIKRDTVWVMSPEGHRPTMIEDALSKELIERYMKSDVDDTLKKEQILFNIEFLIEDVITNLHIMSGGKPTHDQYLVIFFFEVLRIEYHEKYPDSKRVIIKNPENLARQLVADHATIDPDTIEIRHASGMSGTETTLTAVVISGEGKGRVFVVKLFDKPEISEDFFRQRQKLYFHSFNQVFRGRSGLPGLNHGSKESHHYLLWEDMRVWQCELDRIDRPLREVIVESSMDLNNRCVLFGGVRLLFYNLLHPVNEIPSNVIKDAVNQLFRRHKSFMGHHEIIDISHSESTPHELQLGWLFSDQSGRNWIELVMNNKFGPRATRPWWSVDKDGDIGKRWAKIELDRDEFLANGLDYQIVPEWAHGDAWLNNFTYRLNEDDPSDFSLLDFIPHDFSYSTIKDDTEGWICQEEEIEGIIWLRHNILCRGETELPPADSLLEFANLLACLLYDLWVHYPDGTPPFGLDPKMIPNKVNIGNNNFNPLESSSQSPFAKNWRIVITTAFDWIENFIDEQIQSPEAQSDVSDEVLMKALTRRFRLCVIDRVMRFHTYNSRLNIAGTQRRRGRSDEIEEFTVRLCELLIAGLETPLDESE